MASRFTVVGHSDAKKAPTAPAAPANKAQNLGFLKNIVQSNMARTAAVSRIELPTPQSQQKDSTSKVSFGSPSVQEDKNGKKPPTQSALKPSITTPNKGPVKSALKKTSYEIPVNKAALVDSDITMQTTTTTPTPSKLQKSTKINSTPSKSATPSKSTNNNDNKKNTATKPSGGMPGFFGAGAMPDFNSRVNKAEKRKKPTPIGSNNSEGADAQVLATKRQKGNDTTPVSQKTTSKPSVGFMSAENMANFDDSGDDTDFSDADEAQMKSMFGGDSDDDSGPDFGDDSDNEPTIKKKSPKTVQLSQKSPKSTKLNPQTRVQLGTPGKKGPGKVVKQQKEEEEAEMDGFISDDDDDSPQISQTAPPTKTKTPTKQLRLATRTQAPAQKTTKKTQFVSDDDDDGEEVEMDGFFSDSDQDDEPQVPQKSTKPLKPAATTEPITKPISTPAITIPTPPPQPAPTTTPLDIYQIPNNLIPFTTSDIDSIPTTNKTTMTIYYPLETNPQKRNQDIIVSHYDLITYQDKLHSLLYYPYLNTLKETFNYSLQSELHERFLWQYLPAPVVPRHNLISRSSSLHNASNHHILLILNEEMIRHQQTHTLYNKFNKTFAALKDNSFNHFEQWAIRNLSISPSLLPRSLTVSAHRNILFNALRDRRVQMQTFVPPTVLDKFTLHTVASKQLQSDRDRDQDILLGSIKMLENDRELVSQLKLRGVSTADGIEMVKKYSKVLKSALSEIKNAQTQLSSKGCHQKDTVVRVTEDINKSTMNQDVGVIYNYIKQFDKISITFHTGIGPVQLSLPHTVKLIIMYICSMILNHCFDDVIVTKLLNLSHNQENIEFEDEFQHCEYDYTLLSSLISMTLPQLEANFTPSEDNTDNTNSNLNQVEIDGEVFSLDQDGNQVDPSIQGSTTTPTDRQFSPQLTKQVAHILIRIQDKLPNQSILYQYISMVLTGMVVVPKIPNLKQSSTPLPQFPQPLAQAIVTVLFKYDSLHGAQQYNNKYSSSTGTGGGNQAAVPNRFLQQCGKLLNTNVEAFASPLNAYYSTYCSAFVDSDAPFGSLGSFFHFKPRSGSIFVNPPFAADTILASIIHAEQLLAIGERAELTGEVTTEEPAPKTAIKHSKSTTITKTTTKTLTNPLDTALHTNTGLTFIFVFPYKPDELYTKWITTSPFCQLFTILPARQHIYTLGRQETNVSKKDFYRPARHDTILAILQNDTGKRHNPVSADIVAQLLKHFMVHIPQRTNALKMAETMRLMSVKAIQPKVSTTTTTIDVADSDDNVEFDPHMFGLESESE